jgi:hypothetical protein
VVPPVERSHIIWKTLWRSCNALTLPRT